MNVSRVARSSWRRETMIDLTCLFLVAPWFESAMSTDVVERLVTRFQCAPINCVIELNKLEREKKKKKKKIKHEREESSQIFFCCSKSCLVISLLINHVTSMKRRFDRFLFICSWLAFERRNQASSCVLCLMFRINNIVMKNFRSCSRLN